VYKHGLEILSLFPVLVFEIETQNKSGSCVMVLLLTLPHEGKMFIEFFKILRLCYKLPESDFANSRLCSYIVKFGFFADNEGLLKECRQRGPNEK
jgi:hypothetical protein